MSPSFSESSKQQNLDQGRQATTEAGIIQTSTVEGAAFHVPQQLQSDIDDFRSGYIGDLKSNEFVVANSSALYVVFTDQEPSSGDASVEGIVLDSGIDYDGLSFGVVDATSVTIDQTGTPTMVADISTNPGDYAFELVRLSEHHQSMAIRTRDDTGSLSYPMTTGIISEADLSPSALFEKASAKIRSGLWDPVDEKLGARLGDFANPLVYCFSFENDFWEATAHTIDGIVLPSGTEARDFVDTFDEEGLAFDAAGEPLVTLVDTSYDPTDVTDVKTINEQSDSLDGEIIGIEADVFQLTLSTQELLEDSTGCSEDLVQIKEACVDVLNDVVLHGGVAWTNLPESDDQLVPVIGLSSWEQFDILTTRRGTYQIVAEVVTTERIDESLPEATALLVYDMKKTGDIDYDSLASEIKDRIETIAEDFKSELEGQARVGGDDFDPVTVRGIGDTISSGGTAQIEISAQEAETVTISKLWTDWQLVDATLQGGTPTDNIQKKGEYEITWSDRKSDVSPSISVVPDSDTYVGGEYLVDIDGNDGNDSATATLNISE